MQAQNDVQLARALMDESQALFREIGSFPDSRATAAQP